MAKWTNSVVLDAALKYIQGVAVTPDTTNARTLTVCSAQPTTYTEAVSTYMLASTTLASTDFTISDNTVAPYGRKLTTAAKSGIPVNVSGTANYIAICDGTNLLVVTTCTAQTLTAGNTITIPAFNIIIGAPT